MKTCTQCLTSKPADLEHFHRDKRAKSGLNASCKVCRRAYIREYQRYQKRINPEGVRKKKRDWARNARKDPAYRARDVERVMRYQRRLKEEQPERWAELLAKNDEHKRIKRADAGMKVRVTRKLDTRSTLPVAPLVPYVVAYTAENDIGNLAKTAGVTGRLLYRVMYESDRVSLDAADKLCVAMGLTLALVYDDEPSTTTRSALTDERKTA